MSLKLHLYHGRKDPDETPDYPGFDGPTLTGVKHLHATYNHTFLVTFDTYKATYDAEKITGWIRWDDHALLMDTHEDMIRTKDGFFGDWGIY